MRAPRASASRSIAAAPATMRWRCATPRATRTPPITGSTKTSLMCSAARRSATSSMISHKPPTIRSTRGRHRSKAGNPALHILARIVGLVALPLLHQLVELGVALLRQHDADGGKQIAAARFRRKAFALETEGASARRPRRHRDLDRLIQRRHPHLGAQRRLVKRDRQVEPHAGAGLPGHALAFEPDVLAAHDADRNFDVHILAVRQVQPLGGAVGRIRQRHRHFGLNVGADTEILRLEIGAATARAAAEGFAQNILEAAKSAAATAGSGAAAPTPGGAGETFRAEVEAFEIPIATEAGTRVGAAAAAKAMEAGLALGVDLAAIERLALVLVLEDLVRGVQLGKARRRLRIVLVGVGMQLFCQAPIGALDVGRARFAVDAQDLIGITHPQATPLVFRAGPAAHRWPNVG